MKRNICSSCGKKTECQRYAIPYLQNKRFWICSTCMKPKRLREKLNLQSVIE